MLFGQIPGVLWIVVVVIIIVVLWLAVVKALSESLSPSGVSWWFFTKRLAILLGLVVLTISLYSVYFSVLRYAAFHTSASP